MKIFILLLLKVPQVLVPTHQVCCQWQNRIQKVITSGGLRGAFSERIYCYKGQNPFPLHMNGLRVSSKNPTPLPERAVNKQRGFFSLKRWVQAAHCSNMWADVGIIGWKISIHDRYIQADSAGIQFFHCAGKLLLKKTKFKRELIQH